VSPSWVDSWVHTGSYCPADHAFDLRRDGGI